jgi:hypothetical protein
MTHLIRIFSIFLAALPLLDIHLLNVRAKPWTAPAVTHSRRDGAYA